jgi:hypothetical protein
MAVSVPVLRGTANSDTSASTLAVTTTGAIASGAKIILVAGWRTATTLSSVAGGSLTWVIDRQQVDGGAARHYAFISANAPSGLASSTAITLTFSGNTTAKCVVCLECANLEPTQPAPGYDETASADNGVADLAFDSNSTAVATGQADELALGASFFQVVQASVTWTSSFTALTLISSPTRSLAVGYRVLSATGVYSATGTNPTSSADFTAIITYYGVIAAATVLPERIVAVSRP